jgi:hypothetical protein
MRTKAAFGVVGPSVPVLKVVAFDVVVDLSKVDIQ